MIRLLAVLVLSGVGNAWSQVLLTDSFDSSVIDSEKWYIDLPMETSQAYVSNGKFVTYDRGIIRTKTSFNPYFEPYMVEGVFTVQNWETVFCVTLRSNGNLDIPSNEPLGIRVGFWSKSTDPGITINPIYLNSTGLGVSALPPLDGSSYAFAITDFGNKISVAINGSVVEFDNVNDYNSGGSISLFSSYYGGLNQMDNFKVSSVPEPSSLSLLLASWVIALPYRKR